MGNSHVTTPWTAVLTPAHSGDTTSQFLGKKKMHLMGNVCFDFLLTFIWNFSRPRNMGEML